MSKDNNTHAEQYPIWDCCCFLWYSIKFLVIQVSTHFVIVRVFICQLFVYVKLAIIIFYYTKVIMSLAEQWNDFQVGKFWQLNDFKLPSIPVTVVIALLNHG